MEQRIEREGKYVSPSKYITEYLIKNCRGLFVGFVFGLIDAVTLSIPLLILKPEHPLGWFVLPIAAIAITLRGFTNADNATVNACTLTLVAWSFIAGFRVGTITLVATGIVNIIMILAIPKPPPPD